MGETDLAIKIITSTARSCYGSWLEKGATALLENFPNYDISKDINSQNHHFLGDFSSWMIRELAGIKINPAVNDPHTFEISPRLAKSISAARATYRSPANEELRVAWTRAEGKITLLVTVPDDMHGTVAVGDICEQVEAGNYRYVFDEK
jgi:alpha-L-rhamnosidase